MRKNPSAGPSRSDPIQAALAAEIAQRLRRACLVAIFDRPSGRDEVALTIPRAAVPLAPVKLARSHPGGSRERQRMQAIYERCLQCYRDVIRPSDTARGVDDVGAVAARFVASNWRALRGGRVSTQALLSLERQLAGVVHAASGWSQAAARDRQVFFEKLAVLTVFVSECADLALLQGEAAMANLRRAAAGYLHELLGVAPEMLTIGDEGLALRPGVAMPAAAMA